MDMMATLYTVHFSVIKTFGFFVHTDTQCEHIYFDCEYFTILEFNWIIWKANEVVAVVVIQPQSTQSLSFNWNLNGVNIILNNYIKIGFVIILMWNILYALFSHIYDVRFEIEFNQHIFYCQFFFQVQINW